MAVLVGNAWASETTDPTRNDNSATHRVVVPIEADQAISKYVYLPPDFYRRLIQLSRQRDVTPPTWLLSKTTMSATLEVERETNLLALSSLEVTCDLEALQAGTFVQLPVHLTLNTRPRSVKVDGREAEWQWDAFAQMIRFSLSQLGRYRVTIELEPVIRSADNRRSVELTLPTDAGC